MSIRKEFQQAKAVLLTVSPFTASLLNKARVVVTQAVPTAAVDKENSIAINPDFFKKLSPEERVFVLAHETFHWAFLDVKRVWTRDPKVWNVVTDGVNNDIILEFLNPGKLRSGMITLETLERLLETPRSQLREMTKEQIYDLFKQQLSGTGCQGEGGGNDESGTDVQGIGANDPLADDLAPGVTAEGEVLQKGDKNIYDATTPEDLATVMKRAIAEAEQVQKMRGTMPAGLRRMVDRILRPKVPWRTLLRQALRSGLGRATVMTWQRPNRKRTDAMGRRRITTPTVWVGVDTSGSIGGGELEQFLGEVHGIAKQFRAKVVVVPWDAEVYEPIELTTPSKIHVVKEHLHGGGGTDPRPFLQLTRKRMKSLDAVVILSDGYIGDPESYQEDALAIKRRASTAIFVSTGAEVRWPGWKYIRLEL